MPKRDDIANEMTRGTGMTIDEAKERLRRLCTVMVDRITDGRRRWWAAWPERIRGLALLAEVTASELGLEPPVRFCSIKGEPRAVVIELRSPLHGVRRSVEGDIEIRPVVPTILIAEGEHVPRCDQAVAALHDTIVALDSGWLPVSTSEIPRVSREKMYAKWPTAREYTGERRARYLKGKGLVADGQHWTDPDRRYPGIHE